MSEIRQVIVQLEWKTPFHKTPRPNHLRGAIAGHFPTEELFHQHHSDGVRYRFPLIHYRCFGGQTYLVGYQEAADLLLNQQFTGLKLRLGSQYNEITGVQMHTHIYRPAPTKRLLRYQLITPWLPLNQERYQEYRKMSSDEQAAERDRLAVAGLLIGLRGVGVEIDWTLYAAVEQHSVKICQYKNNSFHGILGDLITNVELPAQFALGRAVSHGFGWLTRADEPYEALP